MEIRVNKLRELMELLKPVVPKKPTLKVAAYICLGNGKAVATDLDTMVIADLPEAKEPILLPFASLAEMLKYVPGEELLKIEAQNRKVSLAWAGGSASYPTEAVQDFPVLPEMPTKAEGLIDGDTLISAMLAALPYTASDDSRPVLSGVCLTLGNPIVVDAGDGFRMSHHVLGLSFPLEEKVIVPAHGVDVLVHVFTKTPRTPPADATSLIPIITAKRQLHMALTGENKLRVDFGTTASVVINLIQGNPPDWLQLIPTGQPMLQSQLFAPQLEAAVRRVRDIAKEGSGIVRMEFANGKLTVSARGDDQEISAIIDTLNTQGEPGRTALNHKYLLVYLAGKQGIVMLSQYTKTGPVVFQYQNAPRVLIMPMQVAWGDEKPAEAEKTGPKSDEAAESPENEAEKQSEPSLEEEAGGSDQAPDSGGEATKVEQETGVEAPVTE